MLRALQLLAANDDGFAGVAIPADVAAMATHVNNDAADDDDDDDDDATHASTDRAMPHVMTTPKDATRKLVLADAYFPSGAFVTPTALAGIARKRDDAHLASPAAARQLLRLRASGGHGRDGGGLGTSHVRHVPPAPALRAKQATKRSAAAAAAAAANPARAGQPEARRRQAARHRRQRCAQASREEVTSMPPHEAPPMHEQNPLL
jgi:hypothetical protein